MTEINIKGCDMIRAIVFLLCGFIFSCGGGGKSIIQTDSAPKPIGPYSQAVWAGNTLYISGQIGIDPATNQLVNADIRLETEQVMKNLGNVLKSAGLSFGDVAQTSIFLMDIADFKTVNEVYSGYFSKDFPARATVQVAKLPAGAKVEISMIAFKP
jgi:2-iminobutanoate/2-iminopropanoate deaminase